MKRSVLIFMFLGMSILIFPSFLSTVENAFLETRECTFSPQEMPSMLSNGDSFPTDSVTINGWVDNSYALNGLETNKDMISHAWGLWAALTTVTDQVCDGEPLRLFETWYSPQDVMRATMGGYRDMPQQINSTGNLEFRAKFESSNGSFHGRGLSAERGDIVGKVKFNPATAEAALDNKYYLNSVMTGKKVPGKVSTIELPTNSVALKPIYRVLTDRLKIYDGMYRFHKWSGKSDGLKDDDEFESYVYVCTDANDSRIDNVTVFGIDVFIHHTMSAAEAHNYNISSKEGAEYSNNIASAGDMVIVLGSHVASRESTRWTWQTFYWTPTPDSPVFPSSVVMAEGRNTVSTLDKASSHYAVSLGYSMLSPAAPENYTPGITTYDRGSVYALNPFIEGTFTTDVFANQEYYYNLNGLGDLFITKNVDGLTSSCMGCHSQATYLGNGQEGKGAGTFIADQYVPRNAPWFTGELQTDFLWSLTGSFEVLPKGFEEYNKTH